MHILWLGDPLCSNQASSGGKAANLSQLAQRFPVPPGFCVTTQAFEAATAAGLDLDHLFLNPADFPPALYDDIAKAYQQLDEACETTPLRVAVRSSAADEDGQHASFAGQHETYLNVVGLEALCEAILRCWASAFSQRAMAYRRSQGYQAERIRIGVLVQQLIPADVSLVLFSANPLNRNPSQMVINASWGLGESVVSGSVTPDVYVLDKARGKILERTISLKTEMMVQAEKSTRSVKVPRVLQQRACLNDVQLRQVAELAKALEAEMGWPVDIECAFFSNQLYLLQCRPITTLHRKENPS